MLTYGGIPQGGRLPVSSASGEFVPHNAAPHMNSPFPRLYGQSARAAQRASGTRHARPMFPRPTTASSSNSPAPGVGHQFESHPARSSEPLPAPPGPASGRRAPQASSPFGQPLAQTPVESATSLSRGLAAGSSSTSESAEAAPQAAAGPGPLTAAQAANEPQASPSRRGSSAEVAPAPASKVLAALGLPYPAPTAEPPLQPPTMQPPPPPQPVARQPDRTLRAVQSSWPPGLAATEPSVSDSTPKDTALLLSSAASLPSQIGGEATTSSEDSLERAADSGEADLLLILSGASHKWGKLLCGVFLGRDRLKEISLIVGVCQVDQVLDERPTL